MSDFFRRRRERESAIPPSAQVEQPSEALGSFANPEGQPVVGRQLGGGLGSIGSVEGMGAADGLAMLSEIGPMIQKAMAEGNVQIEEGGAQTIDMRGTGFREEILGIMQQHGIDAESASASRSVDAADYDDMQRQILEALARHGIDPGASGSSINFQIEPKDE